MQDLLTLMRRQAHADQRNPARNQDDKDNRVTEGMLRRGEGSAYAGYIKGKVKFPVNAPQVRPVTGRLDPERRDQVEVTLGLKRGELTSHGRNVSVGVTSTRLYALRGPVQFRPYLLERKGYKSALQIKVDAGMLVIVGKAKTKTVPAHWRVELHCGNEVTVLHTGFNQHGHPANKDAAIGNAYRFLVK